jgi:DnaB-like helicase N terminal domain
VTDHLPGQNADDRIGDPQAAARSSLVVRAEQALLGAVMSDPLGQAAVLDLVRPGDMRRPYHGQVLAAMQRLRAGGVAPAPVPVRAELARDPDLPPRVSLDGALLADLLEAAPRPGHAPAYAAMVIDHGIRQRVQLAGSRMIQAAETGSLEIALQLTARGRRDVGGCQARWDALPEPVRRELAEPAGSRAGQAEEAVWQLRAASEEIGRARRDADAGAMGDLHGRLELIARHVASAAEAGQAAGQETPRAQGEPRPRGRAAEVAGERFLRDLAAGPGQVPAVRPWLRPAHFARPGHGHLYALICDMSTAGKPVDPVTAAWEAARRGIQADAGDLEGGTAPFAVASAREVYRYGFLARISQAGRDISTAASNPQVPLSRLLRDAGQRLRHLEREPGPQSGWQGSRSGETRSAARPGSEPGPSSDLSREPGESADRAPARPDEAVAEPA